LDKGSIPRKAHGIGNHLCGHDGWGNEEIGGFLKDPGDIRISETADMKVKIRRKKLLRR
jgi:hypothetical protein